MTDVEDNIWLASDRGVIKLSALAFKSHDLATGLVSNEVSAILQLDDGRMILGSQLGFSLAHGDQVTQYPFENATPDKMYRILRIVGDGMGTYYIVANMKGLGVWDGKGSTQWLMPPNIGKKPVVDFFIKNGRKYVAKGHVIFEFGQDQSFTEIARVKGTIRKIQTLDDGRTLVISDHITLFEGDSLRPVFRLINGRKRSVYGFCQWGDELLVATLQGVQKVVGDSIVPYKFQGEYSIKSATYAFLVDSRDNLWVGTSYGIHHISGDVIRHYNMRNGLIGDEINRNALVEDSDGRIWIGTDRGASVFDYSQNTLASLKPKLKIKTIQSKSKDGLSTQEDITLPFGDDLLEFEFVGVSFSDEKSVNYRYRLIGYEDSWVYMDHNNLPRVRYTNLPPTCYQLEVQARNNESDWTVSAWTGVITVRQPFIGSWGFYVLLLGLAVILGSAISLAITSQHSNRLLVKKVNDKTAQIKTSEEQLKEKNYSLLRVNEELDRFVYSVSHDLKSPLNSVKGLLEAISLADTPQERDMYLSYIGISADRLLGFIDELHHYARNKQQSINPKPIDFDILVDQCMDAHRFSKEAKEVKITSDISTTGEFISDPYRINIALSNLLSNAIRYGNKYAHQQTVHIHVIADQSNATLTVKDNGIGISTEQLPRIFDMYKKGESKEKGSTGLGLYIVQEAVEKIQGKITVESTVGIGTTFKLKIPTLELSHPKP